MSWMKYINLLFWVLLAYLFYLMVSLHIPYQLHQLEHTSLFVDGTDSFLQSLLQLGGFGKWVALFGTQLFAFWGIASWVFILPVLILFAVTAYLLPIIRSYALPVASWGAVSLLLSMFDYNNGWVGAVSLSLSFCVLLIISFLRMLITRTIVFLVSLPCIAWLFGPVVWVYLICGICLLTNERNYKLLLFSSVGIVALMFVVIHSLGMIGTFQQVMSPIFYYDITNDFPLHHWIPWSILALVFVGSRIVHFDSVRHKVLHWTMYSCAWLLPCGFLVSYAPKLTNKQMQVLYRLNHYSYTENWDSILRVLSGIRLDNWLYMNYLNMALAQKGLLGDNAFLFKPQGRAALMVNLSPDGIVRMLKSDINYAVGCIAEAQHQAFDAQIAFHKGMGIQTLKRLVQTNLIFGHYAVAEKYLDIIEKTTFYKEWAQKYRTFLYDDEKILADAELGEKRRSLVRDNRLVLVNGWTPELENIVRMNPLNRKAMDYLGIAYLLGKEMDAFRLLIEQHYGTDALPQLPVAFQQAALVLYRDNESMLNKYGILQEVKNEYNRFLEWEEKNKNNPNRKRIMESEFGHTYWYYAKFI